MHAELSPDLWLLTVSARPCRAAPQAQSPAGARRGAAQRRRA